MEEKTVLYIKEILKQFDKDTINKAIDKLSNEQEYTAIKKNYKDFSDNFKGKESTTEDRSVLSLSELREESLIERLVGDAEFLPIHFLDEGSIVQKAVARVVVGVPYGTGFLISPSLFMTNNHVISSKDEARRATIEFNYQLGYDGIPKMVDIYRTDPDDVFYTNVALDFSLFRLLPSGNSASPGSKWGFLRLVNKNMAEQQRVNIIQHPQGRRKEVALHDNKITHIFGNVIRYRTDTEPGSSGSCVLDNEWDVIALHHAGGDRQNGEWLNNEGIRIDKIIEDLRNQYSGSENGRSILNELGIN